MHIPVRDKKNRNYLSITFTEEDIIMILFFQEKTFLCLLGQDWMPKSKKCSRCNKKFHACAYVGNCKCISKKYDCSCSVEKTEPSSSAIMETKFPRICPCSQPKCQETWQHETATEKPDDDEDYIVFHCTCHDISLGKTSFHCDECSQWFCQDCAPSCDLPNEVFDVLEDLEDIDRKCKRCATEYYAEENLKLQEKIRKMQHAKTELDKMVAKLQEQTH